MILCFLCGCFFFYVVEALLSVCLQDVAVCFGGLPCGAVVGDVFDIRAHYWAGGHRFAVTVSHGLCVIG